MNLRSVSASLFLLLALSLALTSMAKTPQAMSARELFARANAAYSRGDLSTAMDDYRRIEQDYGISAPLLYNLGNTLAAAGDTGRAVLYYERALRLAPGDQDIRHNLRLVRQQAGLYLENQPLCRRAAGLLGADQWALIAAGCFTLLAFSLLLPQLSERIPAGPARWIALASLLVLALSLPAALQAYRDWNDGVVVSNRARLLVSPLASAASTGTIAAGRLVRPEQAHGDYLLVTDETGRSGWLHRADIILIVEAGR